LIVVGALVVGGLLFHLVSRDRTVAAKKPVQQAEAASEPVKTSTEATEVPSAPAEPAAETAPVAEAAQAPEYGPDDAPTLFETASLARACGDADGAVALVRTLWECCPGTKETVQGLLMLGEMANLGEAPATLLPEAYERLLESGCEKWPDVLEPALPHFADHDALNDWTLHWKYVIGMAQSDQRRGRPFRVLMDAVRVRQGDDVIWGLLETAIAIPELQPVHRRNVTAVFNLSVETKGDAEALNRTKEFALKHPVGVAGSQAVAEGYKLLQRTAGEAEIVEYMKGFARIDDGLADGPGHDVSRDGQRIKKKAQRWLSDYYFTRNDLLSAVALYCQGTSPENLFSLPVDVIESATSEFARGLGQIKKGRTSENITIAQALSRVADLAHERERPDLCEALYYRAACMTDEPKAYAEAAGIENEGAEGPGAAVSAESALTTDEMKRFWRAFILWREGETSEPMAVYRKLLETSQRGKHAAQMYYDIADWHLRELRYGEATKWVNEALAKMPENQTLRALSEKISAAVVREQETEALVVELRQKLEQEVLPAAKAGIFAEIAQAEVARGHLDEGIQAYREVWEKYPETPQAPRAMLAAAETMIRRESPRAEVDRVLVELVLSYPGDESAAKAQELLVGRQGG
jgi:tetratricopeptide (TPR) repeat protein